MAISFPHDAFCIDGDSQSLAIVSSGGAVVSMTVFGSQTRFVQVAALGGVTSTSGVRLKFVSVTDSVVSSTLGAVIPVGALAVYKVVPGQRISAISNDAAAAQLIVTPLSD
jgi:hypothetical protein